MKQTDEILVDGLKRREAMTMETIYRANYPTIEKMILGNSGSKDDAKDIFQDAMVVLYNNSLKEDFALTSTLKTYLYSVSWRLWMKVLKHTRKDQQLKEEIYLSSEIAIDPDQSNQTEPHDLTQLMNGIGQKCLDILKRFYFENQRYQLIANDLGYASGQVVKEQKYRCMKKIRANIKK